MQAYYNKALADRALANSTCKKELMALVMAIQHWRPYLLGVLGRNLPL